ncbi:MAG: hypothetical protein KF838_03900 [Phycisphaeraceae bacterium]|nr:MAG: hypothetical protein KF838_03900 [Phycisphaeraceae bacterium]
MSTRPDSKSPDPTRQRWSGLAVLIAVAITTGFAPSSFAWAVLPGVERALYASGRECGQERASARQIHEALARAVRELLKGSGSDQAITKNQSAASFLLCDSVAAIETPAAPIGLMRSETLLSGRLPQPPPAA